MIADHKGEIPVVILLLPFIAGICLGLYIPGLRNSYIVPVLLALSALFFVLNVGYGRFNIYKKKWLGGALLHPLLLLAGCAMALQHHELNDTDHFTKLPAQYLVVHISNEPKLKGDLVRFTADVKLTISNSKAKKTSGSLLVTIKDKLASNLFYGQELLIPADYNPVDPPFNPGEFNYKGYLAHKNIHYQSFFYPGQYRVIKGGAGNAIIAYALQVRQNLVKKLQANMHDTTAVAVASTLILGYKADLSNDVLQAYSKTGTIHILSVSGGHVAIIYLLLGWMLSFLNGSQKGKIIKAVNIIFLIWGYALLTGFSPAVNRAALMISMVIGGKTFMRYINNLNILAFSAFVLLLYDPFLIADVGFQLSYVAVAGLVVLQPIVYNWFKLKNRLADYLWKAGSVSLSAQVITFPLSAFYFHQFPVYFLVSNLLIIAPVVVIMYVGLLLLALPQMAQLSTLLGYVLENTILLMNQALAYIEQAPYASIGKIWLTRPEFFLLYLIIIALFYFWFDTRKTWLLKLVLFAVLAFSMSISLKKIRADGARSVTFLSLRKHSGIVFKNGSEGVVLTDLPETDKNFQYAIQPGLDSMRITNYKTYRLNEDIRLKYLIKQHNLVQFYQQKILLLNQYGQIQSIPRQLNINYLYVSQNPYVNKDVCKNRVLLIDGNNSDTYIDKLKNSTVNCKILKRNKSITITSNW